MIYTRFGSEVKILSAEKVDGQIWVTVLRKESNDKRIYLSRELKADNGIQEIEEAIKKILTSTE
jgi:hypothetical protein